MTKRTQVFWQCMKLFMFAPKKIWSIHTQIDLEFIYESKDTFF